MNCLFARCHFKVRIQTACVCPVHAQVCWICGQKAKEPLEWLYSAFGPFSCPLVSHAHPGKINLLFEASWSGWRTLHFWLCMCLYMCVCVCVCARVCFPGYAGLRRTFTVVQLIKPEHCSVRRAEKGQCSGAYQVCVFTSVFCQRCVCLLTCLSSRVCVCVRRGWTSICQRLRLL